MRIRWFDSGVAGLVAGGCCICSVGFADSLSLLSGKVIQGTIIQETPSQVKFESEAGIVCFAKTEISAVKRDNTAIMAELQTLAQSGKGTEVGEKIARLDRSRFSAQEIAAIDQLKLQVESQAQQATAQAIQQQDLAAVAQAKAIYEKAGWRESASYLQKACDAASGNYVHSQAVLMDLYSQHATYVDAVDFAPKAEQYTAGAPATYSSQFAALHQKFQGRLNEVTAQKESRDQAFASAGDARARLEAAEMRRDQIAAIKAAPLAAAQIKKAQQQAAMKKVEPSPDPAKNAARANALRAEAMKKANVKPSCKNGVCPFQ